MKIIPANGGGPGMDKVFLSGYGDGDYTPRPRSGPLPSLLRIKKNIIFFPKYTEQTFPNLSDSKFPHNNSFILDK